jgi:hypothetical protein
MQNILHHFSAMDVQNYAQEYAFVKFRKALSTFNRISLAIQKYGYNIGTCFQQ